MCGVVMSRLFFRVKSLLERVHFFSEDNHALEQVCGGFRVSRDKGEIRWGARVIISHRIGTGAGRSVAPLRAGHVEKVGLIGEEGQEIKLLMVEGIWG